MGSIPCSTRHAPLGMQWGSPPASGMFGNLFGASWQCCGSRLWLRLEVRCSALWGFPPASQPHAGSRRKPHPPAALYSTLALAAHGFKRVVGVDIAPSAVAACQSNAAAAGNASVQWKCGDMFALLPKLTPPGGFDFLFDCQVMHTLPQERRGDFGRLVAECLAPGGQALVITGNAQDSRRDAGPTMLTAVQTIQPLLGAGLHLLHLAASSFATTPAYGEHPPGAWVALLTKPLPDALPAMSPLPVHNAAAERKSSTCSGAEASLTAPC